jgi:peptidoglycan/xylan/chitin deacetylase (PgdA/CDA1 family)
MSKINIPILMYHSIELMPRSTIMRSLHVPPKRFKLQMWILKALGYKGLSLKNLQPYLRGEKQGKVVGITFDDGYQNNFINAAPILKKYKFSATCYLVSKRIGSFNKWDVDKGIDQRPLMTEDEIFKWLDLGLDIGAHSKTHVDLTSISEQDCQNEIYDCKEDLENKFKVSITDFCYPYGHFNESVCTMTKNSGFHSATTMIRGRANPQSDNYQLPRIPINHHTLPHLFIAKILTNYEDRRK